MYLEGAHHSLCCFSFDVHIMPVEAWGEGAPLFFQIYHPLHLSSFKAFSLPSPPTSKIDLATPYFFPDIPQ